MQNSFDVSGLGLQFESSPGTTTSVIATAMIQRETPLTRGFLLPAIHPFAPRPRVAQGCFPNKQRAIQGRRLPDFQLKAAMRKRRGPRRRGQ